MESSAIGAEVPSEAEYVQLPAQVDPEARVAKGENKKVPARTVTLYPRQKTADVHRWQTNLLLYFVLGSLSGALLYSHGFCHHYVIFGVCTWIIMALLIIKITGWRARGYICAWTAVGPEAVLAISKHRPKYYCHICHDDVWCKDDNNDQGDNVWHYNYWSVYIAMWIVLIIVFETLPSWQKSKEMGLRRSAYLGWVICLGCGIWFIWMPTSDPDFWFMPIGLLLVLQLVGMNELNGYIRRLAVEADGARAISAVNAVCASLLASIVWAGYSGNHDPLAAQRSMSDTLQDEDSDKMSQHVRAPMIAFALSACAWSCGLNHQLEKAMVVDRAGISIMDMSLEEVEDPARVRHYIKDVWQEIRKPLEDRTEDRVQTILNLFNSSQFAHAITGVTALFGCLSLYLALGSLSGVDWTIMHVSISPQASVHSAIAMEVIVLLVSLSSWLWNQKCRILCNDRCFRLSSLLMSIVLVPKLMSVYSIIPMQGGTGAINYDDDAFANLTREDAMNRTPPNKSEWVRYEKEAFLQVNKTFDIDLRMSLCKSQCWSSCLNRKEGQCTNCFAQKTAADMTGFRDALEKKCPRDQGYQAVPFSVGHHTDAYRCIAPSYAGSKWLIIVPTWITFFVTVKLTWGGIRMAQESEWWNGNNPEAAEYVVRKKQWVFRCFMALFITSKLGILILTIGASVGLNGSNYVNYKTNQSIIAIVTFGLSIMTALTNELARTTEHDLSKGKRVWHCAVDSAEGVRALAPMATFGCFLLLTQPDVMEFFQAGYCRAEMRNYEFAVDHVRPGSALVWGTVSLIICTCLSFILTCVA